MPQRGVHLLVGAFMLLKLFTLIGKSAIIILCYFNVTNTYKTGGKQLCPRQQRKEFNCFVMSFVHSRNGTWTTISLWCRFHWNLTSSMTQCVIGWTTVGMSLRLFLTSPPFRRLTLLSKALRKFAPCLVWCEVSARLMVPILLSILQGVKPIKLLAWSSWKTWLLHTTVKPLSSTGSRLTGEALTFCVWKTASVTHTSYFVTG